MAGSSPLPRCPRCGSAMVRRERRSDGAPFLGCSRYPECRGIRDLPEARPGGDKSGLELDFHRPGNVVLFCGALTAAIAIGLAATAPGPGAGAWALCGAVMLALAALSTFTAIVTPQGVANSVAIRVVALALLALFARFGLIPVSQWLGQVFSDYWLQNLPTPHLPTPSPR